MTGPKEEEEVYDVVIEEPPTLTKEEELARLEVLAREMEADDKRRIYQESLDVICAAYPRTDLGNNKRFVQRFGKDIRYCHPWRVWFIWNGSRWEMDESGRIMAHGKYAVNRIEDEAGKTSGDHAQKEMYSWSGTSQGYNRIKSMIALSASDVPILPHQIDADKNLINFPNGTLEIDTMAFREHKQADLCSKMMGAPYDLSADCPLWKQFIGEIFEEDQDLIQFVQRALGYSLTAEIKERAIFLCYGSGANGKSTLLNTAAAVMGDYAQQTESSTFTVQKREQVRNDLAALKGARLVLALESGKDKKLDEAIVKQVSGGDKIAARFLFKEYFEYIPEFKIWWGFNHRPRIDDSTESIWDRIKLIPFNLRIPEEKRDLDLPQKLQAELPGILKWMLEGLREYRRIGLAEPEIVRAATAEYQEEQDILGEWIGDECVREPRAWTASAELYTSYHIWSTSRQETPMSPRKFGFEIGDRFKRDRDPVTKRKGYKGIRLKGSPTLETTVSTGNQSLQIKPEIEKVTMGNHKSVSPVLKNNENSINIKDMEKTSYGYSWLPFEKEAQNEVFENEDKNAPKYEGMTRDQLTEILMAAGDRKDKIPDPDAWLRSWEAARNQ
jgi:putative DNA primase/helicase